MSDFKSKYGPSFKKTLDFMKAHLNTHTCDEWDELSLAVRDLQYTPDLKGLESSLIVAVLDEMERLYEQERTNMSIEDFDAEYRSDFAWVYTFALTYYGKDITHADTKASLSNDIAHAKKSSEFLNDLARASYEEIILPNRAKNPTTVNAA